MNNNWAVFYTPSNVSFRLISTKRNDNNWPHFQKTAFNEPMTSQTQGNKWCLGSQVGFFSFLLWTPYCFDVDSKSGGKKKVTCGKNEEKTCKKNRCLW